MWDLPRYTQRVKPNCQYRIQNMMHVYIAFNIPTIIITIFTYVDTIRKYTRYTNLSLFCVYECKWFFLSLLLCFIGAIDWCGRQGNMLTREKFSLKQTCCYICVWIIVIIKYICIFRYAVFNLYNNSHKAVPRVKLSDIGNCKRSSF